MIAVNRRSVAGDPPGWPIACRLRTPQESGHRLSGSRDTKGVLMELRHVDETSFLVPALTARTCRRSSQAGFTMIEVMFAGTILVIGSLGMLGLIIGSIATNNRSKIDSTQTMLSQAIVEQLDSTVLGSGSSTL